MSSAPGRLSCALIVVAASSAGVLPGAGAQSVSPPGRHVTATLLAESDGVQPGRPLSVGIRLRMEPGWHTYWRNPGDSGLPTRVRWTLPGAFSAGELRWPYPERFVSGPLVSYGYEREVLLLAEIRVPDPIAGNEVRLSARVDWLECQEACVPGRAEVSLTLPVRKAVVPGPEARAFAEVRRRLPAAVTGWRFSASLTAASVALGIEPAPGVAIKEAYFYALSPRLVDYAKPQTLERTRAGYRLVLGRDPNAAPAERLAGVLVLDVGGRRRAIEIDAKMEISPTRTR